MPHFEDGNDVQFALHGEQLTVSRREGKWRCRWRGHETEEAHLDQALAKLLGRSPGTVLGLTMRLLRAAPGTEISD